MVQKSGGDFISEQNGSLARKVSKETFGYQRLLSFIPRRFFQLRRNHPIHLGNYLKMSTRNLKHCKYIFKEQYAVIGEDRGIFSHLTCATEINTMSVVLKAVSDQIVKSTLVSIGVF